MFDSALSGRRVLLTGHTGFKGAWLALLLARLGAEVNGLALDPIEGALFTKANVAAVLASDHRVDIRSRDAVEATIRDVRPDFVFHLAAQPLVRESYVMPLETFDTNVMGTLHVLNAARTVGARGVLVITTDKVYRNEEVFWGYREPDALGGDDPYSASKACAEIATHAMRGVAPDLPIATARAGNVLGGGDVSADRLVPDLFRGSAVGEVTQIRNPGSVRPWQHVLDPLWGYVLIAEGLLRGECRRGWNLGPDSNDLMTVGQVADTVCGLLEGDAAWAQDGDDHPHEAGLLLLDSTLARLELDWVPRIDARATLRWSVEWEQGFRQGADARALTEADIDRYLDLVATDSFDRGA
jgi:CDP-glucose 4,6-dehydratase